MTSYVSAKLTPGEQIKRLCRCVRPMSAADLRPENVCAVIGVWGRGVGTRSAGVPKACFRTSKVAIQAPAPALASRFDVAGPHDRVQQREIVQGPLGPSAAERGAASPSVNVNASHALGSREPTSGCSTVSISQTARTRLVGALEVETTMTRAPARIHSVQTLLPAGVCGV